MALEAKPTGTAMTTSNTENQHSDALAAAKRAVRSYARDPSETNQDQVSQAWRRVRDLASSARRPPPWIRAATPQPRHR